MNYKVAFTFSIHILLAGCLLFSQQANAMCGAGVISYYRDKDGWYYGLSGFDQKHNFYKKIEGADLESFHVLPGHGSEISFNPCTSDSGYAADKLHVYRGTAILPDADPASFSFLAGGYARDANHVYYLEKLLGGANAESFQQVASGFFKDKNHVYLNGVVLTDADPATFVSLDSNAYPGFGLAHDAFHVFFGGTMVANANPKNLKVLGHQYWSSNKTIFFASRPLAQVDHATFSVPGEDELAFSAQDEQHYFLDGMALSKTECKKVGEVVLACKGYILTRGRKYSEIDPSSLHYLGRFPHRCQVTENSMIYQDNQGIYAFYGDGGVMKFLSYQPDRQFESLDQTLEDRLCAYPGTWYLKMEQ